ncbi:MAG TPA: hypothetical protein VGC40_09005 [Paenirhodobacter sp.]
MARRSGEDVMPVWKIWIWGGVGVAVVLGLFAMVWQSQFAAAQGYLFDTRSPAEESGYCLAVAQDVFSGGPPVGSYVDEASKFWLKRLRSQDAPMGPTIVQARKRLSENLLASTSSNEAWMTNAMDLCSRRAVMYGMKFRAFE